MSRLAQTFAEARKAGRGCFIPFVTAGDPSLALTDELLPALAKAGADIIELGIPFSDPVADGEVIQRASERALQKGVKVADAIACVKRARQKIETPIVLFSYWNPILQFGAAEFARAAREAGADAVLVTDLIIEEADEWSALLEKENLDPIFLVAPTTSDERLARIAQRARGFIYAIARAGVTGRRETLSDDARQLVSRLRRVTELPVAVGFGISRPEHVREVWSFADGAVVGSALVREIEQAAERPDLGKRIAAFTRSLVSGPA